MRTKMKQICSLLLAAVLLFGAVPLEGLAATAQENAYKTGDIISFGKYPQSQVTEKNLISELDAQPKQWLSYEYYSGTGSWNGRMQPGNWMRYADIHINGVKYRAVVFDTYRPGATSQTTETTDQYSKQDDNGFYHGHVYYFRYDPLKWRVLDPASGLLFCEMIIDAQPYQNMVYRHYLRKGSVVYQGTNSTTYANDYETSSIRKWLNDDFYKTAFSSAEQSSIKPTYLDNSACSAKASLYDSQSTTDSIFLLSYKEITNSDYGFNPVGKKNDPYGRGTRGTAYARCQGLLVSQDYDDGNSYWLRSPGDESDRAGEVNYSGFASGLNDYVHCTWVGVRPALYYDEATIEMGASADTFGQEITASTSDLTEVLVKTSYSAEEYKKVTFSTSDKSVADVLKKYDYPDPSFGVKSTDKVTYGTLIVNPHKAGSIELIAQKDGQETRLPISFSYYNKSGDVRFRAVSDKTDVTAPFTYSDEFFSGSAEEYRKDLAQASLRLAVSAFNSTANKDKKTVAEKYRDKDRNVIDFLTKCGYKQKSVLSANKKLTDSLEKNYCDIQTYNYGKEPTDSTIGYTIASKKEGDYTLVTVAVRGGGYEAEWAGNFHAYTPGTTHPGFNTCLSQVYPSLMQYLEARTDETGKRLSEKFLKQGKVKIWITGYSRAGATTNLVAAKLAESCPEAKCSENVFAYTFEAPQPAVTSAKPLSCNNIHNIVNPVDFVPKVVMSGLGYARYGQNHWLPSASTTADFRSFIIENDVESAFVTKLKEGGFTDYAKIPKNTFQAQSLDNLMESLALYIGSTDSLRMSVLSYILQQHFLGKNGYSSTVSLAHLIGLLYYEQCLHLAQGLVDAILPGSAIIDWVQLAQKNGYSLDLFDGLIDVLSPALTTILYDTIAGTAYDDLDNVLKTLVKATGKNVKSILYEDLEAALVKINVTEYTKIIKWAINRLFTIPHFPELTMALLDASDENLPSTAKYRVVRAKCPVDIEVFDKQGKLVAAIKNNQNVPVADSLISCAVDIDGAKQVWLPGDAEYSVRITATGDGTMDYSVSEYDCGSGNAAKLVVYENVQIKKGYILNGAVTDCVSRKGDYTLRDKNGKDTLKGKTYTGKHAELKTVTVKTEGNGYVSSPVVFGQIGRKVALTAIPEKDERFFGWYQNGKMISDAATLTIRIGGDQVYVCKFSGIKPSAAPAYVPGDVNADGSIGADDARLALRRSVDLEDYAEGSAAFLACDVNGDNAVGADDARLILRASVDLEDPATWRQQTPSEEPTTEKPEPVTAAPEPETDAPEPVTAAPEPVTQPTPTGFYVSVAVKPLGNGQVEFRVYANNAKGLESLDLAMDLKKAQGLSFAETDPEDKSVFANSGAFLASVNPENPDELRASFVWAQDVAADHVELMRLIGRSGVSESALQVTGSYSAHGKSGSPEFSGAGAVSLTAAAETPLC